MNKSICWSLHLVQVSLHQAACVFEHLLGSSKDIVFGVMQSQFKQHFVSHLRRVGFCRSASRWFQRHASQYGLPSVFYHCCGLSSSTNWLIVQRLGIVLCGNAWQHNDQPNVVNSVRTSLLPQCNPASGQRFSTQIRNEWMQSAHFRGHETLARERERNRGQKSLTANDMSDTWISSQLHRPNNLISGSSAVVA